jgi:hypothetical protein
MCTLKPAKQMVGMVSFSSLVSYPCMRYVTVLRDEEKKKKKYMESTSMAFSFPRSFHLYMGHARKETERVTLSIEEA